MNEAQDDVELLMLAVEDMMTTQQAYFARRMDSDKKSAMVKEERVRLLLKNYRRKGYRPENKIQTTRQQDLFKP